MVAWVVIDRRHARRTPRHSRLAPIPILGLTPPSSQKKSPLSFHALTWSPFCNPFVFTFMHGMGGGGWVPFFHQKKKEQNITISAFTPTMLNPFEVLRKIPSSAVPFFYPTARPSRFPAFQVNSA